MHRDSVLGHCKSGSRRLMRAEKEEKSCLRIAKAYPIVHHAFVGMLKLFPSAVALQNVNDADKDEQLNKQEFPRQVKQGKVERKKKEPYRGREVASFQPSTNLVAILAVGHQTACNGETETSEKCEFRYVFRSKRKATLIKRNFLPHLRASPAHRRY